MITPVVSILDQPAQPVLLRNRRLWIYCSVALSLLVCFMVFGLYALERKTMKEALRGLDNLRQARIDLGKGYLHIMMASQPGAPFDDLEGIALLRQAIRSFNDGLEPEGGGDQEVAEAFRRDIAAFERALADWKLDKRKPGQTVALQVAFSELERQADAVDSHTDRRLHELSDRLGNHFFWAGLGSIVFLGVICGCVFYVERLGEQWEREAAASRNGLRQNQQFLADLVEHSGTVLFIKDVEGRYQFVNSKWEEAAGLKRQDVLNRRDVEIFPGVSGEPYREHDLKVITTHASVEEEQVIATPDGPRFFISVKFPLRGEGETIQGVCGVATEITGRKAAEEALRQSEARFRSVVETAPEAIFIQTQGCFSYVNPMALKLFGAGRAEELLGTPVVARFHPDYRAKVRERIRQLNEFHKPVNLAEERILQIDGRESIVEISAVPFVYDEKNGALVFFRDIGERKRAETQIKKLSSAVEQSPVGIIIADASGAIEYVNPRFTRMSGYALEEVQGHNMNVLKADSISPEEFARLWETGAQGREWHGEFRSRKKNGELYWEFASVSPVVNSEGQITHFLMVEEDITDRKKLEEQLRQSQKLESIGQLAGGVAHDFNNILVAMMMHLGFLQKTPGLNAEARDRVEDLMTDTRRAASLTRQLLMFSRRSVLEVKVLSVNELVKNLLKMLGRLIGEHIRLRFEPKDGLPLVEVDPGMLEQVLVNLAVNARDAMPKGGDLSIRTNTVVIGSNEGEVVGEKQAGTYVCLTVADTGCGMDESVRNRVFEPFFTTKELGKGTGLGLATAHGIVAQHKGWMEVESSPGLGAEFRVYLPVSCKSPSTPVERLKTDQLAGDETILLAEDDAHMRIMVAKSLRSRGYRVIEAGTGREALDAWSSHRAEVDLLFTDMLMPDGMTGLDLALQLKREKPGVKAIISSGYSLEQLGIKNAADCGFTYLSKPYLPDELARAVRDCLDQPERS